MTKYNLKKMTNVLIIVCIFFTVRATFWIYGMQTDDVFQGDTLKELYMLGLSDGYFGTLEQTLVGTILLIIAMEYMLGKDESNFLIRYSSRSDYLCVRIEMAISVGIGIVICKFLIGIIFLWYEFGNDLIFTMATGRFVITGVLVYSFFSIRCGIVYLIFRDLLNKRGVAMGITVMIYFLEFYIWLDNLLHPLVTVRWMPFLDLSAAADIYAGQISLYGLLLAGIRQVGLTTICLLIWMQIWKRKDVMNLEK